MEFVLDPTVMLLLCSVAFLAGFIDAIAGGGGLLTVPALLTAGLPPHLVLGTNKLAATFGSLTASVTYYRKKLFDPYYWRHALIATAIGACIGVLVVDQISKSTLEKVLPVLILIAAIYSLFAKVQADDQLQLPRDTPKNRWSQRLQGLGLGFYDGIAGPGTGSFWMVSTMALYKINLLLTSGVARSMNFVSNGFALVTFAVLGHIHYQLGIAMGLCLMVGSYFGAHTAIRFGSKLIKPLFMLMVMAIALRLIWQTWINP
ncbi:sulfite exporter TauE/SafE family protein [Rheinheimera sp. 4Y26]|uniref:sulfite exporter TauE/SafE family protein n=1 Tax=Rheinheimera sp. 4Y26 TaxID=2977811 RepID=UPI0021B0E4C5|nr:TSUP family transporter [Rheinheimera sp. 4Y26]MCT6700109.1 TSUP family transporter [Rheinheimera sp. 4Y26]